MRFVLLLVDIFYFGHCNCNQNCNQNCNCNLECNCNCNRHFSCDTKFENSHHHHAHPKRTSRQYRYEPPPEFPLILPCSGIVHHLSGPDTCALSLSTFKISDGCRCTDPGIHLLCACAWTTRKLAHILDSSQEHSVTNKKNKQPKKHTKNMKTQMKEK